MAMRSFLELIRKLNFVKIQWFPAFFCRFFFRIYKFSRGNLLPPSKISSSCRSD